MQKSELLRLAGSMEWSRERILAMLEKVSDADLDAPRGGSFGSLRATLVHLLGAEQVWGARLHGRAQGMPQPDAYPTRAAAGAAWREATAALLAYLEKLPEGEVTGEIQYANLKGQMVASRIYEILLQLFAHHAYHRGQIVYMLREMGHPVTGTDFMAYCRQH